MVTDCGHAPTCVPPATLPRATPYIGQWRDDLKNRPPTTDNWLAELADADSLGEVESTPRRKSSPGGHDQTSAGDDWRLVPAADELELDFRHRGGRRRRGIIAAAMFAAGYPFNRQDRFNNCGGAARVYEHARTGEFKTRAFYCHDRWCEKCSQAKTLLMGDNLLRHIAPLGVAALHVVLTTRHNFKPLTEQVSRIVECFTNLRTVDIWQHAVAGGAYFIQTHVAEADGAWHVHLHIIAQVFTDAGSPRWLDSLQLSLAWHEATGDSTNVHVSRIHNAEAAAREVTRYAAKPCDGNSTDDPEKLAEMMVALRSRRLCATFGSWRKFRLSEKPPIDPAEIWLDHGSLVDLIWRARRGEEWANRILDLLWARTEPKRGPPGLFDTTNSVER